MATPWDAHLKTLVNGYRIVQAFGLRDTRVIVRSRSWSGGKIQTGTPTLTDLEILPRPEVVGVAGDPVVKVGPIVPAPETGTVDGTYTPQQLSHPDLPDTEWYYVVIGRDGVERPYKLMKLDTITRPGQFTLDLTSLDRKVPF